MDIVAPLKTPFHSTADGIILFSGWKYPFGNTIIIYHGGDYFSFYGHNFENLVFEKESVKRGHIIGLVGNSGETSGPHLHFEIWKNGEPIDPSIFISELKIFWFNLSFKNVVPFAIALDEMALAKIERKFFDILLSNIRLIFSLLIFFSDTS